MKLTLEQLAAIAPYVKRLAEQGPAEDSKSNDGALTMTTDIDLFPGASVVHVWQITKPLLGKRILVDIVAPGGKVETVRLKPKAMLPR